MKLAPSHRGRGQVHRGWTEDEEGEKTKRGGPGMAAEWRSGVSEQKKNMHTAAHYNVMQWMQVVV